MSNFATAVSAYLATSDHTARISKEEPAVHARRRALVRKGKVAQAAAVRKAGRFKPDP